MVEQTSIADVEGALPEDMITHAVTWQPLGEFTGEIHPVADLFPMMTDDELDDLAEDIKANGLMHPIVLDDDGALIDGRNRLSACLRANLPPRYTRLSGPDPVAFILSMNVSRRHLSKGQSAMAIARANRFLKKQTVREAAKNIGVHNSRIAYASVVLDYAPDLADAVLSGAVALNAAYDEARNRKLSADSREARLSRLQAQAPDLAVLVQEERLSLSEAVAALEKRDKEERDYVALVTRQLDTALVALDPGKVDPDETARNWMKANPNLIGSHADFSSKRARRAADALLRYAELKENEDNG